MKGTKIAVLLYTRTYSGVKAYCEDYNTLQGLFAKMAQQKLALLSKSSTVSSLDRAHSINEITHGDSVSKKQKYKDKHFFHM